MAATQRVPIGDRIKTQRRNAGVTQRDLAAAVGVSPAYLSLIESDKRQIGGRLLNQIAAHLGVELRTFTTVSDDRLAAELEELLPAIDSEERPDNPAGLVAHSAQWARLVIDLHDRALQAEHQVHRLADRFARDPTWVSFAHDILSRITSIRSTAEILTDADGMNDRQRLRFTRAMAGESARLSDVARELIDALQAGTSGDAAGADMREVDAFLSDREYYFDEIEAAVEGMGPFKPPIAGASARFAAARAAVERQIRNTIEAPIQDHRFRTEGAAERARGALSRYAAGALVMPYGNFRAAAEALRYDIEALSLRFDASFEQVAHRLTSLRRPGAEGVRFAFLRVDPAGNASKRLSTPDIRLPLFGACPQWAVFEAFAQPERIVTQLAELGGEPVLFVARALRKPAQAYNRPGPRYSVMLACSAQSAPAVIYGDSHAGELVAFTNGAKVGECSSCGDTQCGQLSPGLRPSW